MIFYFSGTGNSYYAAKRLLAENEVLINMAEAVKQEKYEYSLNKDEKLGFVFPVYFYTLPSFVSAFIDRLDIENASYVYAVITCGGGIAQAGSVLKKKLKGKGMELSFVSELLMPDNSMLFYQIPPKEAAKERISRAEDKLKTVKKSIDEHKRMQISENTIISDLIGKMYEMSMKTGKFTVETAKCISCGLCEKNCPEEAIKIRDGHPVWIKDKCCKCSSCINRCPKEAIQFGKRTDKRNRYVNEF